MARRAMVFERPLCVALDGFTLHAATRAGGLDAQGREALLKYILRPAVAQERVPRGPDGLVRIALEKAFSEGTVAVGLAIARHIVERHGGRIHVVSAGAGRGATFTVELPLAGVGLTLGIMRAGRTGEQVVLARPRELRDLKVLLVDDEEDVLILLSELLESRGAKVRVATSAAKALRHRDAPPTPLT